MTDDELVELMAKAIDHAPNGLDGDPIGVSIAESCAVGLTSNDLSSAKKATRIVCEEAARAALSAIRDAGCVVVPKTDAWDEAAKDALFYGTGFILRTPDGDERIDPKRVRVKLEGL